MNPRRGGAGPVLYLGFGAEGEVAGVAEAGDDITFGGQLVIDGAAPDLALGLTAQDEFYSDSTGDGDDDMDLGGVAFLAQVLDGLDERGARGQHRVGDDNDAAFEFGAGDVIEADLETAVALMPPVSRDESIICAVEVIQQSLVQGQAGAEDGGDDGLFLQYFTHGGAQGRLDFPFFKGQGLADLISGDFSDALEIASEPHPVLLDVLITDLADPVTEQGILFA